MKDEPRKPLEALGDEALEARVVAWVLGEASAFEAAELEKRCASDADLMRFANRMREMHGLIESDGKAADDEDWRLPEAKRRKVVDVLGVEPVVRLKPKRKGGRRIMLALAACLMASLIALPLLVKRTKIFSESSTFVSFSAPSQKETFGDAREFNYPTEYEAPESSHRPTSFRSEFDATPSAPATPSDLAGEMAAEDDMASIRNESFRSANGVVTRDSIDSVLEAKAKSKSEQLDGGRRNSRPKIGPGKDTPHPSAEPQLAANSRGGEDMVDAPAVPTPGDLPVLGRLFSRGSDEVTREEEGKIRERSPKPEAAQAAISGKNRSDKLGWASPSKTDTGLSQGGAADDNAELSENFSGEHRFGLAFSNTENGVDPQDMADPFAGTTSSVSNALAMQDLGLDLEPSGSESGGVILDQIADRDLDGFVDFGSKIQERRLGDAGEALPEQSKNLSEPEDSRKLEEAGSADGLDLLAGVSDFDRSSLSNRQPRGAGNGASVDGDARPGNAASFGELKSGETTWGGRAGGKIEGALANKGLATVSEGEERSGEEVTDYSKLTTKETIRRKSAVDEADRLLHEARESYSAGDYREARERYLEGLDVLPESELTDERRFFFKKSLADAEVADAEQLRRVGKKNEAEALLESAMQRDPQNEHAADGLAQLADPIRSNPALGYEAKGKVDEMRRDLYSAEGAYDLGKFDEAKRQYAEVVKADPGNAAARRELEKIEAAKSSYYRAAYDNTRAELLAQVDESWEFAVPPAESKPVDASLAAAELRLEKLKKESGVKETPIESQMARAGGGITTEGAELAELRDAVEKQQDRVEDKRKTLTTILRNQELIYRGSARADGRQGGLSRDDEAKMAALSFAKLAEQKITLDSQIETLEKYDDDQLMSYAAGLQLPENVIKNLQPEYLEAKRELEVLKQEGYGKSHPGVVRQKSVVEAKKRELDQGISSLKTTLRAQRELAAEQSKQLQEQMDEKKSKAVQQGIGLHGFDDAKQEYEVSQKLLEALKVRLALIEGNSVTSGESAMDEVPQMRKDNSVPLDAMAEISASDEACSTFSMHVSDASFKLAAAAIQRGEVPAAESIRPEEFYNAFDYGDPAPTANEPVACAVEQCAHPAFPQRNLLRIAVRTGAEGRAQSVPLNLTLLLDNSGSMEREDRAEGLNQAVAGLSSLLKEGDTVTVAGFSRQPRLLADRIDGRDGVTLNGLVEQTPAEGGTNLEEALKLGHDLAKRQFKEGAQNRVVLFTDGAANLGDADPESLNRKVEQLRNEGIAFDAAGFGADGLNDRLLERLTRNGNGRYYIVDDADDANEGFAKQLAGAFRPAAENVKVQVIFNPSRVGNYKLIGFEEHRLKKEDFRDDSVDAAEMASEEAGVALYQFEILPEGQGEVGEVSVRFRDTSSGEMVEQSWPIPYDPQAPSFDEAKPGLQLAGIAAFVAEKLRGAPLADAVDYTKLRGVMGRVKAEYSGNERVIQLERMMKR